MFFRCGQCQGRFQVADEKIKGKALTIRCRKCSSSIRVAWSSSHAACGEPVVAEVVQGASQRKEAVGAGSLGEAKAQQQTIEEWYYATDGRRAGPFSYQELGGKLRSGEVTGRGYAWNNHLGSWRRIFDIPELKTFLAPHEVPPLGMESPPSRNELEEDALSTPISTQEQIGWDPLRSPWESTLIQRQGSGSHEEPTSDVPTSEATLPNELREDELSGLLSDISPGAAPMRPTAQEDTLPSLPEGGLGFNVIEVIKNAKVSVSETPTPSITTLPERAARRLTNSIDIKDDTLVPATEKVAPRLTPDLSDKELAAVSTGLSADKKKLLIIVLFLVFLLLLAIWFLRSRSPEQTLVLGAETTIHNLHESAEVVKQAEEPEQTPLPKQVLKKAASSNQKTANDIASPVPVSETEEESDSQETLEESPSDQPPKQANNASAETPSTPNILPAEKNHLVEKKKGRLAVAPKKGRGQATRARTDISKTGT